MWLEAGLVTLLLLCIGFAIFISLICFAINGAFATFTSPLIGVQVMLDFNATANGVTLNQVSSGMTTLCFSPTTPTTAKSFSIKTNQYGIFIVNNGPVVYDNTVYLQPNQTYSFSLNLVNDVWILTSSTPIVAFDVSPTLSWVNFVADQLVLPPPKVARKLCELSLALYQSVATYPGYNIKAAVNEAGRAWCNSQIPTTNTDVVYNKFPFLPETEKNNVVTYVNTLIVQLTYSALAEDPVYAGVAPTTPAQFLWNGTDPLLPNWNAQTVGYIANHYTTIPGTSTASIPGDATALQFLADNRTEAQTQIGLYFKTSPPPHLTHIFSTFLASELLEEKSMVQTMCLLQISMADAGVFAWTTKFTYWIIRPFMYIPNFTPLFTTPNFPGLISGHSTFAGAIGLLCGLLLPKYMNVSEHIAQAAANSREYAGIHFHTDDAVGLVSGRQIGASVKDTLKTKIANYAVFV